MMDERKTPGSIQPRMGNTCPERLDEMRAKRDHWKLMWQKADEEARKANDLLRRLMESTWYEHPAGMTVANTTQEDSWSTLIREDFFMEVMNHVNGK